MECLNDELKILSERLGTENDVERLRFDIKNLIVKCLIERGDGLDYWEKDQFAYAIACIQSSFSKSKTWLRLSLVSIHNAYMPQRSEYVNRYSEIESLTSDDLILFLEKIL
jgi:hypothetical protein